MHDARMSFLRNIIVFNLINDCVRLSAKFEHVFAKYDNFLSLSDPTGPLSDQPTNRHCEKSFKFTPFQFTPFKTPMYKHLLS